MPTQVILPDTKVLYTVKANPVSNRLILESGNEYKNISEWDRDDNLNSSSFSINEFEYNEDRYAISLLSIFILDLYNLHTKINGRTSSDRL